MTISSPVSTNKPRKSARFSTAKSPVMTETNNNSAPSSASRAGLLTGVTIVDLSHVLAGPYCTMQLAELGARVIKVERPGIGDDARHIGPYINGVSAYFTAINRGKESVVLNLKDGADKAVLLRMLEDADVLVENNRPGTMARLGLDLDDLHARFPRLIIASISGFGQNGPYAQKPAYDMVVQAMGGLMSVTGQPDSPPTRVGSSIGDIAAGIFGAVAISAALYRRAQTGEGEMLDVAMLDCQVAILENAIARYVGTGEIPHPLGSRHPSIAPFAAYRAQDGFMVIAAGNDKLFAELCAVLGLDDLPGDPRFAHNETRCDYPDELRVRIEEVLVAAPIADWIGKLEAAGIPCGPIHTVDQVLSDPQIGARHMVVEAMDEQAGPLRMAGNPIKTKGVADPLTRPRAPRLGEQTDAIKAEFKPEADPGE